MTSPLSGEYLAQRPGGHRADSELSQKQLHERRLWDIRQHLTPAQIVERHRSIEADLKNQEELVKHMKSELATYKDALDSLMPRTESEAIIASPHTGESSARVWRRPTHKPTIHPEVVTEAAQVLEEVGLGMYVRRTIAWQKVPQILAEPDIPSDFEMKYVTRKPGHIVEVSDI